MGGCEWALRLYYQRSGRLPKLDERTVRGAIKKGHAHVAFELVDKTPIERVNKLANQLHEQAALQLPFELWHITASFSVLTCEVDPPLRRELRDAVTEARLQKA